MGNQEHVVQHTTEELQQMRASGQDQTNWKQVDAQSEAELEATIDQEDEGDFDWSKVEIGMPQGKQQMTVRIDIDVIEWFRSQGAGYQTRMNQVLRRYVEAQKK